MRRSLVLRRVYLVLCLGLQHAATVVSLATATLCGYVTVTIGVSNGPVTLNQNATIDSLNLAVDLTNSGAFTLSGTGATRTVSTASGFWTMPALGAFPVTRIMRFALLRL